MDLTSTEIGDLLLKMGPKTMEREIRWKIPSYEVWKRMELLAVGKLILPETDDSRDGSSGDYFLPLLLSSFSLASFFLTFLQLSYFLFH